jgi:hypothetical protein
VPRWPALVGAAALCAMLGQGCVDQIMVDSFISEVRAMEGSIETLHDFEVAKQISESNIGHLEGLYRLDNDSNDMQYLLTHAWSADALRFMLDAEERERARGDAARATYHRRRLRAGFARARFFATRWLRDRDDDFDRASRDPAALRTWLADEVDDAEDAPMVLWAGIAWAGQGLAARSPDAASVAAGRVMLEHSARLAPDAEHGLARVLLALDQAGRSDPSARETAARAVESSGGKYLPAVLARTLVDVCLGTPAPSPPDLTAITTAGDVLPAARLDNLLATQHARRYRDRWARFAPCPLPSALKARASR